MRDDRLKTLPHNNEAEVAVLGAILMDYNSCIAYVDIIRKEWFYKDSHAYIFDAISILHQNGKEIDQVTVNEQLSKEGKTDKAGGTYYLTGLAEETPSSANIKYYIDIVNENYEQRSLILLGEEIKNRAYLKEDPILIKEYATEKLIESLNTNVKIISKDTIVEERKKGLIDRISGTLIATGFPSIDKYLSVGFSPKKSSIICGRTRAGKSCYKANLTVNQCKQGLSILHVTPEQGFDAEMDRLTSIVSGIPLMDIIKMKQWASVKKNRIVAPDNQERLNKIIRATEEIESWNLHFLSGIVDMSKIRQASIEIKMKYGLDIVYIDLFDRIREVREEIRNKPQKVTQVISYLQRLEEELNTHFCSLVQIRRDAEKRKDRHPMLSDLKESGSFEEEAWTVFGVYREALYDDDAIDDSMEIMIMKQRQGPSETIELIFDKETLTLIDPNQGDF
uniref:DNA 5'-3' helicase n=1 Tax=viral metagenome TaxID=1070528 RepID=A0A6H1ZB52_9ZZZZ